ncbi:MAG: hypothetical protein RLZZ306_2237 [Bacteroidota bacterium]
MTKSRFAPHGFDEETIENICKNIGKDNTFRFVAITLCTRRIIGYFIAENEVSENDRSRFLKNEIDLKSEECCSIAPSISDDYQGSGVGMALFKFMMDYLKEQQKHHLILLGGVQKENEKAIRFYQKMGFQEAGEFDRNGVLNLNMWMMI